MAKNISVDFLGKQTDKFSGADITELCQLAAKAAIRESIECDEQRKALMKDNEEEVEEMVFYQS